MRLRRAHRAARRCDRVHDDRAQVELPRHRAGRHGPLRGTPGARRPDDPGVGRHGHRGGADDRASSAARSCSSAPRRSALVASDPPSGVHCNSPNCCAAHQIAVVRCVRSRAPVLPAVEAARFQGRFHRRFTPTMRPSTSGGGTCPLQGSVPSPLRPAPSSPPLRCPATVPPRPWPSRSRGVAPEATSRPEGGREGRPSRRSRPPERRRAEGEPAARAAKSGKRARATRR